MSFFIIINHNPFCFMPLISQGEKMLSFSQNPHCLSSFNNFFFSQCPAQFPAWSEFNIIVWVNENLYRTPLHKLYLVKQMWSSSKFGFLRLPSNSFQRNFSAYLPPQLTVQAARASFQMCHVISFLFIKSSLRTLPIFSHSCQQALHPLHLLLQPYCPWGS